MRTEVSTYITVDIVTLWTWYWPFVVTNWSFVSGMLNMAVLKGFYTNIFFTQRLSSTSFGGAVCWTPYFLSCCLTRRRTVVLCYSRCPMWWTTSHSICCGCCVRDYHIYFKLLVFFSLSVPAKGRWHNSSVPRWYKWLNCLATQRMEKTRCQQITKIFIFIETRLRYNK